MRRLDKQGKHVGGEEQVGNVLEADGLHRRQEVVHDTDVGAAAHMLLIALQGLRGLIKILRQKITDEIIHTNNYI